MTTLSLTSPVKFLKGVGPKRAEALQRLGVRTAGDLLYHVPHRYLDATTVTPLARAMVGQEVTCVGRVVSTGVLPTRRGLRVFRAVLKDESGLLECAWPGRPFLERQIKKGQLLLVTGPVRYYHGKQIVPREFIILAEDEEGTDSGLVLPIYPATEGLTHRQIRALVQQHLDELLPLISDPHPAAFRARYDLIELRRALELMHRPKRIEEAELGRRRLAFDEPFDEPLAIRPELLLGRMTNAEKASARERIASGGPRIVVGTHALIQESVAFRRLGLTVIDEQHRFGVEQRAALVEKGNAPDVLLLTATPIPRSLALTLYGDLDVTELRERPPGRGTVKTALRTEGARAKIYEFIRSECAAGRQAYVIYPVIDESERADLKAATTMAAALAGAFPELRVGLVHGRQKPDERDGAMRAFRDGAIHILVATSVIEVGIDVPNATVMLIEHAERFGLAQLHQLRGRVGRGAAASHCILLCDVAAATPRLRAFTETTDGFRIAELDLQERGMGELAGARQSGGTLLRYANFATDLPLLEAARRAAGQIIARDPMLAAPEHAAYRARIVARYERGFELFRVG